MLALCMRSAVVRSAHVRRITTTWTCVTGRNMDHLLKRLEPSTASLLRARVQAILEQAFGLTDLVEVEERKQENSRVSYMDILRSMDKVPVESVLRIRMWIID